MSYFVYILICSDGSYYTGHTEDVESRLFAHNAGEGSFYTAKRRPVKLAYHESQNTREIAIKREQQIKKWSKAKKAALINGDLNQIRQLAKRVK